MEGSTGRIVESSGEHGRLKVYTTCSQEIQPGQREREFFNDNLLVQIR